MSNEHLSKNEFQGDATTETANEWIEAAHELGMEQATLEIVKKMLRYRISEDIIFACTGVYPETLQDDRVE